MKPPFYPLRPVDGGQLELAPPKIGDWLYEPKINGWRVLVHTPTRTMYNRHLDRLSIEDEFAEALSMLPKNDPTIEWLDCEALSRRHNLGRGCLVVLDIPRNTAFEERKVDALILVRHLHGGYLSPELEIPRWSILPHQRLPTWGPPLDFYEVLKNRNETLGVPFYEGVVAKEKNSKYPLQAVNAEKPFPFWVKHRFMAYDSKNL